MVTGFERDVLSAFQQALLRYSSNPAPAWLGITISTVVPLALSTRRTMTQELPTTTLLVELRFTVDPDLPDPGFRVDVHDATTPGPTPGQRGTEPLPTEPLPTEPLPTEPLPTEPAPGGLVATRPWIRPSATIPFARQPEALHHEPVIELSLSYGRRFQWQYSIATGSQWIPIQRGQVGGPQLEIVLPAYLRSVPRGRLVHVRYWDGRVELWRSRDRPEYRVLVDRQELAPGSRVAAAESGSIGFQSGAGRRSVLHYLLRRRVR